MNTFALNFALICLFLICFIYWHVIACYLIGIFTLIVSQLLPDKLMIKFQIKMILLAFKFTKMPESMKKELLEDYKKEMGIDF